MEKQENMIPNREHLEEKQSFDLMQKTCGFEIVPCRSQMNFDDKNRYTKLELTPAQKIHISTLAQQLPQAMAAGTMTQAYIAKFPEGLPHTLTALRQGGFGSMIQGSDGTFVGSASFYSLSTQAAIMGAFTAMSAITGQYFLSQINSELRQIGTKIDAILEFLYEDKKAELLSEVAFVQYAYENYNSIMQHAEQRVATISNLQQSKKIAIKDVEFYLNDFERKLNDIKDERGLGNNAGEILNTKERLEISLRLYVMSSLLEAYYSQNFDYSCMNFLKSNTRSYIKKCISRISRAFSRLEGRLDRKDDNWLKKALDGLGVKTEKSPADQKISDLIMFSAEIEIGNWPITEKEIQDALFAPMQATEYVLDEGGNVYMKKC